MKINGYDLAVIVAYLVGIVAIGCYAGLKKRRRDTESNQYFMAAHSLRWPSIGLALFTTNISCLHLISLAQAGYDTGLLMGNFEWMAAFVLILLSLCFVPFYIRSKVATLPDFLERRYCSQCRDWLAVISIIAAILFHIAFPLSAGWIVLHGVLGIDKWTCILLICGLTAVYTVVGGLAAVVMTETIQAIVLIVGAIVITAYAYAKIGGWDQMTAALQHSNDLIKLSMLRSPSVEKEFPWYAILLGYPVIGIWYFCTDQTIVQRVLGAKDENHARIGPLFCAIIKILPVFIFVLPGLMFYAIIKSGAMPGVTVTDSKQVYGVMIKSLLPVGCFGIIAAALMAALMGNLASAANSISTLFSYDLWKRIWPETPDHRLVIVGRIAAFAAFVVGIALVPIIDCYESLFPAIQLVIAHVAPPLTGVFMVGIFWGKASARSAKWTMWSGSFLGAVLFTLRTLHDWKPDYFAWVPSFVYKTPFMMMTFYLLVTCVVMQVILSFLLPKLPHEDPERLYWGKPSDALKSTGWPIYGDYRLLSALIVVVMIGLYACFR
jgi:solute:Na+ symporter, SSS family